jgi:NAD(P)-dependent dehydrogenase (short-subunit alcohol dehydrogenase family)
MSLQNRHFVISGGTGALGTAVVGGLVKEGATCHIPNYTPAELTNYPFTEHEKVHITSGIDLTSEGAVSAYYSALPELWGSIQIAGGFAMGSVADISLNDFNHMLNMNAVTCFLCCREAVKKIRLHPGGGRLVNVAARPALQPAPGMTAYAASKSAVISMTQTLSAELVAEDILVNAVVPSILNTEDNRNAMPDANHDDWPKVEDVARIIIWLSSWENQVTTGSLTPVYGKA